MPHIQVLDKQVAELIAAGEVVERPSSVIKELVENAVDAGASVITVEIRRGGTTFMRVTDNGCGISREDVPTAFLRHATSKIAKQDDLDSIMTLGFRGEALASISAVAHVELLTKTREAQTGVRYTCGGEEEPTLEEAGCPDGTTILIRDLFYNTPARMKFLKKDSTEGNSIAGILDKMALSHPEISFRFIRDGKEQLHTPGDNKLSSAIYAVYGREFSSTLIPVEYELEHVKVKGFISTPAGSRPNRSMQNFFINGRYIRCRTAMAALEEAYKGSLMVGKFPACVLHLELAFGAVDVNVHPAKMEVRFVNERPIFDAVYHGVRSALAAGDKPKVMEWRRPQPSPYAPVLERQEQTRLAEGKGPEMALRREKLEVRTGVLRDSGAPERSGPKLPEAWAKILEEEPQPEPAPAAPSPEKGNFEGVLDPKSPVFDPKKPENVPEKPIFDPKEPEIAQNLPESPPKVPQEPQPDPVPPSRVVGEAFGTYLILERGNDALVFIDKHAAHERLLYERLKAQGSGGEAQALLEPVAVTLDKEEYTQLLAHGEELSAAGFEIDDFGAGTVLVRSVPLLLDGADAAGAVMEIAGHLAAHRKDLTTEHLDWVYHNVACRAAMKAGDPISREEMISLVEELERNPQVRYCPHGRPVYILLRRRDIERQFGRV